MYQLMISIYNRDESLLIKTVLNLFYYWTNYLSRFIMKLYIPFNFIFYLPVDYFYLCEIQLYIYGNYVITLFSIGMFCYEYLQLSCRLYSILSSWFHFIVYFYKRCYYILSIFVLVIFY